MDILISDTGALWSPGGQELPRPPLLGPGAIGGVRYGGPRSYVLLRLLPSGARLRLASGSISRACFERVVWLLVYKHIDRAVLDFDDMPSAPELLTSLHDVVARLDELRGHSPGEPPRPNFFLERLSLERLDGPGRTTLQRALADWARARGKITRRALDREIGMVAGPRMLLRVQAGERLQMDALSRTIDAYPPCERLQLIGRDIDEQPDSQFGSWIAGPYRAFIREEEPSLQLLEVAIPSRSSGKVYRARYERLLLPWQSQGGDRWISANALVRVRRVVSQ